MRSGFVALLLLALCFGSTGCTLWPWKKNPPAEAAATSPANSQVTPPTPESIPSRPTRRKGWLDYLFFWRKPPPPSAPAQPLAAKARVYFVNLPARLVILEVPSASDLPVGLVLSGLSQGRVSSTIRIAPERRPPFAVGEILTGDPQRGELLYLVEP